MSTSQFISQIETLMHTQQIKNSEMSFDKSNYAWLTSKKCSTITHMSTKDEHLIRQALEKVSQEERIKVIRQLLSWLDEHPHAQVQRLPEMCILFLNRLHTLNIMNEIAFSRQNSFRNSLRRLSMLSNRVAPASLFLSSPQTTKRCVKFNDKPRIYCISD